ncbi:MAG: hypothetical protein KJO69_04810, partial [Gammaproteobacteria bacterium]|nr:hypothetical protein [Gammaproteobacteria bacterium]
MKSPLNITVIAVVAGIIALFGAKMFSSDEYHTSERIEWKDNAIAELSAIEPAKGVPPFNFTVDGWFSPQGLLMRDGSWIAYRQMCHKEKPKIYDIFIGRASNGKWYYS